MYTHTKGIDILCLTALLEWKRKTIKLILFVIARYFTVALYAINVYIVTRSQWCN